MYASHHDSHIYSYYAFELLKLYEERIRPFSKSVLAYRKLGKNNIHFAGEVFELVRNYGCGVAIAMDVSDFFDSLQHSLLKYQWQSLLGVTSLPAHHYKVFKSVTRYSYIAKSDVKNHRDHSIQGRLLSIQKMRDLIRSGRRKIHFNAYCTT